MKLLLKELLINVTSFFRDAEAFVTLKRDILPVLFQDKPDGYVFRAWVAGCATGEETYSIAMLLREFMDETLRQRVEGNYAAHRGELGSDMQTISPPSQSGDAMAQGQTAMNTRAAQAGLNHNTPQRSDEQIGDARHRLNEQNESIESAKNGIMGDRSALAHETEQATQRFETAHNEQSTTIQKER